MRRSLVHCPETTLLVLDRPNVGRTSPNISLKGVSPMMIDGTGFMMDDV